MLTYSAEITELWFKQLHWYLPEENVLNNLHHTFLSIVVLKRREHFVEAISPPGEAVKENHIGSVSLHTDT